MLSLSTVKLHVFYPNSETNSHRLITTRRAAPFHLELFRPFSWIQDGKRSDAFLSRQSLIPRDAHVRSTARSVFHEAEIRRYDGCSIPSMDELSLGHLVAVALIIMLEDVQQQSLERRSVCNKNQPPPTSSGMSLPLRAVGPHSLLIDCPRITPYTI